MRFHFTRILPAASRRVLSMTMAVAVTGAAVAGAVPTAVAAQPGPIVVSELMWAGSSASSADEWIELYNTSDTTVDLAGWTVTRGDGEDEKVMVVIESGTLAPGETYLIANYGDDDARSRLAATPALVDAGVSLPNSRLRLRLYDGPPETALVVDLVDDGSGAPLGGAGGDAPASMVRTRFDLDGSDAAAWSTSQEASGWDAGAPEMGTPGVVPGTVGSTTDATSVSAASWGRLKAARR